MAAKIDDIQVLHWDNREWGERLLQTLEIVNLIHKIITRITHLGKSLIIIIFTTEMYKLEVLI